MWSWSIQGLYQPALYGIVPLGYRRKVGFTMAQNMRQCHVGITTPAALLASATKSLAPVEWYTVQTGSMDEAPSAKRVKVAFRRKWLGGFVALLTPYTLPWSGLDSSLWRKYSRIELRSVYSANIFRNRYYTLIWAKRPRSDADVYRRDAWVSFMTLSFSGW